MRVRVDPAKCTGHAQCAANAPEVYDLDEHGYSMPILGLLPIDLEGAARHGAAACPEQAVEILE